MRRLALLAALLGLAGCASDAGVEGARWFSGTSDDGRPTALYGLPDSAAFFLFECRPAERGLAFRTVDSDLFDGARPITIAVGRVRFVGEERLERGDGMAIARSRIPLDHPLTDALALGREPIRFRGGRVPGSPLLYDLIRACRAAGG